MKNKISLTSWDITVKEHADPVVFLTVALRGMCPAFLIGFRTNNSAGRGILDLLPSKTNTATQLLKNLFAMFILIHVVCYISKTQGE